MSDEPGAKAPADTDDRMPDPWVMPTPVFRSSEGATPKNVQVRDEGDLDETLDPAADNPVTAIAADAPVTPKAADPVRAKAAPQAAAATRAKPVAAVLAIIVIAMLAVAAAIVYLFYSSSPPDTFQ